MLNIKCHPERGNAEEKWLVMCVKKNASMCQLLGDPPTTHSPKSWLVMWSKREQQEGQKHSRVDTKDENKESDRLMTEGKSEIIAPFTEMYFRQKIATVFPDLSYYIDKLVLQV